MLRELGAELIGTFALVSAVCGAALFSAPSAAGHFKAEKAIGYIIAQVIGGVAAAGVFYIILSGAPECLAH